MQKSLKEVLELPLRLDYDQMDFVTYGDDREAKGEKTGEKKGEAKLGTLISKMSADGRGDDILRAATDESYREEMYSAYGIE